MKVVNLLVLVFVAISVFAGCAREDAVTGARTEDKGMLEIIISEEEAISKPTVVSKASAEVPAGSVLVVADFNSGAKPSNIGGDFGAWDRDPADMTQGCTDSFDSANKHGREGFGMKLDYDVDSSNPAYNGFWMKLVNLDATGFENIVFYVKGDIEAGYTTVFKAELKNEKDEVGKFYVTDVTSEWTAVSISLDRFQGINDLSSLTEFVIVFEDSMATNKDGIIYIDDIQLAK